jgi:hypothetical protein
LSIFAAENLNTKTEIKKIMSTIIKCEILVRYYEDSEINGEDDISNEEQCKGLKPRVPCVRETPNPRSKDETWAWCPEIDGDSGVILNWEKGTVANIQYKVCDNCKLEIYVDGEKKVDYDNYVPDFMCPVGGGFGDYIIMDVDADGKIGKWSTEDLQNFIEEEGI